MPARRTALDWMIEATAGLVLAAMFLGLMIQWPTLPDSVPTHFTVAGKPNAWGYKGGMWLLPVLGAGIYALIFMLGRMPRFWNLPTGVDRNIAEVQSVVLRLLAVAKLSVILTFAYVTWAATSVALGRADGLVPGFVLLALAVSILPALYYCARLRRLRQ